MRRSPDCRLAVTREDNGTAPHQDTAARLRTTSAALPSATAFDDDAGTMWAGIRRGTRTPSRITVAVAGNGRYAVAECPEAGVRSVGSDVAPVRRRATARERLHRDPVQFVGRPWFPYRAVGCKLEGRPPRRPGAGSGHTRSRHSD